MNAYGQGQVYCARASATACCNMAGYYVPQYYPCCTPAPPPKTFCTTQTQTQTPVKLCCDVGTQVDMGLELSRSELKKPEPVLFKDK